MITLLDIQKAISIKLDSKFSNYKNYVEEVKGDSEKDGIKRPSFFINIMPISTDNFTSYKEKLVSIDIMCFSENETIAEDLVMVNSLEILFKMNLSVSDKNITIQSLNFKTVDDILHCMFSLNFTDSDTEFISIDVPGGVMDIPDTEINESLGYTSDSITVMQELNIEEVKE